MFHPFSVVQYDQIWNVNDTQYDSSSGNDRIILSQWLDLHQWLVEFVDKLPNHTVVGSISFAECYVLGIGEFSRLYCVFTALSFDFIKWRFASFALRNAHHVGSLINVSIQIISHYRARYLHIFGIRHRSDFEDSVLQILFFPPRFVYQRTIWVDPTTFASVAPMASEHYSYWHWRSSYEIRSEATLSR